MRAGANQRGRTGFGTLWVLGERTMLYPDFNEEQMTRKIEEYLDLCYQAHSAPRVSEFAAWLQWDVRRVRRCVRRLYGMLPAAVFRRMRLQKAALLLLASDLSVEEVIVETASGDRRGFFRSFRAVFRASPLEYRRSKGN